MSDADVAALLRLHKFCKFNGKPVFGSDMAPIQKMLTHAAAGKDGTVGLVLCSLDDSSDVMGGVTAQLEGPEAAAQDATLVVLSIVVRADQRQLGAGRVLLQALHEQALKDGVRRLATDVAANNQPAISFFQKLGYSSKPSKGKTIELTLELGKPV